jgi:hypothetical protein
MTKSRIHKSIRGGAAPMKPKLLAISPEMDLTPDEEVAEAEVSEEVAKVEAAEEVAKVEAAEEVATEQEVVSTQEEDTVNPPAKYEKDPVTELLTKRVGRRRKSRRTRKSRRGKMRRTKRT